MDIFKRRHPLVPLCLLLSILLLAMFAQSPRITVPALAGAVLFLADDLLDLFQDAKAQR